MNVRIGIADTGREVEIAATSRDEVVDQINKAYADEAHILWFTDVKGDEIGIPLARIAYIELAAEVGPSVGFGS